MALHPTVDEELALQAALLVFWQKGYEATAVIDLAVAMRLNRTRLYDLFDSKHQLFIRALRHYQRSLHGQLLELSADSNETVLTRLRLVMELTVDVPDAASVPEGCFLLKAGIELLPQDTQVQALVDESQQFLESLLVTLLDGGQQTGEVRATASPRTQAHFLVSVVAGLRVMSQLHSKPALLQDTIELALLALAGEPGKEPGSK